MKKEIIYKEVSTFFLIAIVVLLMGCILMFEVIAKIDVNVKKDDRKNIRIIYEINKKE